MKPTTIIVWKETEYILRLLYIKTARDVICTINFRLMALPTMVKNGQVKPLETPCQ